MFPSKNGVHQQISAAISKKWCKECTEILDHLLNCESTDTVQETTLNDYHTPSNSASISRMRERIDALEDLNDRLYYYLCFIVENLPDLIIKTIQSDCSAHTLDFVTYAKNGNGVFKSEITNDKSIPFPTPRERDILSLLERGYSAKEIADELFISETTVITHKKNLKKKFNAKNTVELMSKVHAFL